METARLFKDVSFRLVAGEHVGLVGANGVGKSTLMNILTKQLVHDSGRVEWTPGTDYGYLDQHTVLTKGKTIRDVLRDAFLPLFQQEEMLNEVTGKMGTASGIAPQFTSINGPFLHSLSLWINLASKDFPTPFSPCR